MEGEGGVSSGGSQPMMIDDSSIGGDLNQQPPYPKRKRESPEFLQSKDEDKLREFRKKVNNLRSKHSMDIRFTATCVSDAYQSLSIHTDPLRGFGITYEESYDLNTDLAYVTLLWTLANYMATQRTSPWSECFRCLSKVIPDIYPNIAGDDIDDLIQEYYSIYTHPDRAAAWKRLKDLLSLPDSEREYFDDPTNFEQKLKDDYLDIPLDEITRVLKAFFTWWTSKSGQDAEVARRLITYRCEMAQELSDDRLKRGYTRCDYLKLKLDVARKIGIVNHVPETIAKFHLPGHYEWSSDDE